MSHQHNSSWRPRRFRAFVTNQYWANRDEYDSAGQTQPHTFEQYVQENLPLLKAQYRAERQLVNLGSPAAAKCLI
jgi:hypothetical protein